MPTNCFSFAPRDSVPGLIAKICKYLKNHPGWSEEDLKDEIAKLVHDAGVQSFNGRTGDVVLSSEDVNALKIATAYFGEDDETIDELDIKALYAAGIRFVFTDFNPVTSSYNNSYVLDYFPASDDIAYYPISTSEGSSGAVTSVNGKTGDVTINLADVLDASSAQVKLCTATEFTANTIETWNAYYEDGYRIVGVVNDGATAVDYLYLLKQDENDHQPIEFGSGSGAGAVDSVNGQTGVVTIGEAGVVENESDANKYMQIFVDESEDYPPVDADTLAGEPPSRYRTPKNYGDHLRWYIDGTKGNDENDGSRSAPWKTIDHFFEQANTTTTDIRCYIVSPGRYEITKPVLNGCTVHINATVGGVELYCTVVDQSLVFYNCHLNIQGVDADNMIKINSAYGKWYVENCFNVFKYIESDSHFVQFGGGGDFDECKMNTIELQGFNGKLQRMTFSTTDASAQCVQILEGSVVQITGTTTYVERESAGTDDSCYYRVVSSVAFIRHGVSKFKNMPAYGIIADGAFIQITPARQDNFNSRTINGNRLLETLIVSNNVTIPSS